MTAKVDTLRIAAGQLYECQSPKEMKPPKDVAAILRARLEQEKPNSEMPAPVSFLEYTNKAVESFKAIIERVVDDEEKATLLTNFWDKTVEDATDDDKQLVAKTVLAQLLFLVDNEEDVAPILESDAPSKGIAEAFAKKLAIQLGSKAVTDVVTPIQNVLIGQDKAIVTANIVACKVTNLLIDSNGFFNSALVPDLQKTLTKDHPAMAKTLEALAKAPELLDDFDSVENSSLINGMFDFDDQSLSAKCAVLSACLALPSNKTIAATSSQVVKELDLARFVRQLRGIAATGGMSRRVEGQQQKVHLVCDCLSPLLDHKFQSEADGCITKAGFFWGNNTYLWEVQGIVAACKAIGIKDADIADEVKKALKDHNAKEVTPSEIIDQLADDDEEVALCKYAFLSSYSNPLLDAWVKMTDTVISIRADNRHLVRLHAAVSQALAPHFKGEDTTPLALSKQEKVYTAFLAKLEKNLAATMPTEAIALREAVITALPEDAPRVDAIKAVVANKRFLAQMPSWNKKDAPTVDDFMHLFTDSEKKSFRVASVQQLVHALQQANKVEVEGKRLMLSSPKAALDYVPFEIQTPSQAAKNAYTAQRTDKARSLLATWIRDTILVEGVRDLFDEELATMSNDWDHIMYREQLLNRASHYVEAEQFESVKEAVDAYILNSQQKQFVPFGKTVSGDTVGFFWDAYAKEQAIGMLSKDALVRLPNDWVVGKWEFCHAPAAAK